MELLSRFDLAAVPQVAAIGGQARLAAGHQDLIGGLALAPGGGGMGFESPAQAGPARIDSQRRSQILAAQVDRRDGYLRIAALRPSARQAF